MFKAFALATLIALPALAHGGGLHDLMKDMSHLMKQIDASNAALNTQNAILADKFVDDVVKCKALADDVVDDVPAAQQASAKADYERMMDQMAQDGRDLGAAFRAGDDAKAQTILAQINDLKKQGHGEFK